MTDQARKAVNKKRTSGESGFQPHSAVPNPFNKENKLKKKSVEDFLASRFSSLMKKSGQYISQPECVLIEKAYQISKTAHAHQKRKTGEPFIIHPIEVTHILADLHLDAWSLITGLLHDVVEDTSLSLEDVKKEFGSSVAELVDGMTKLSQFEFKSYYQKESENIRKMLISMGKDVRVILVKLADRLHNMRTLAPLPENRKLRISGETLNIYAPLAGRLGLVSIKAELEDLAFKFTYPEVYSSIFQQFEKEKPKREKYIKDVIQFLQQELNKKTNIQFDIHGRTKNMYSIYKKMQIQKVDYDQVYDIIAFRICTEKIRECYEILGWVHSLWKPIPGRFKDFIAIPKANNYQSLHTTVIGPQGKRVEIQIRTHDMHKIAEAGVAVHWKYKEESVLKNISIQQDTIEKFSWLKDLVALHRQAKHSNEFLESVKSDLFESEIYVFTPKGDVKEFSKGATAIDFAYAVHTDIGSHLKEAKVNGRIVPLKYRLQNGDVVEVSAGNKNFPKREWLNHCTTSKARSKIRSYIREEEKRLAVQMGVKLLEQDLKKSDLVLENFLSMPNCKKVMGSMGLNTYDDIYSQIGYGRIIAKNFIYKVIGHTAPSSPPLIKKPGKQSSSPIEVEGMGNVIVSLAGCCTPLPGEDITGYISLERGIVVHRCSCSKLLKLNSERYVEVSWRAVSKEQEKHRVSLKVLIQDRPGALKEISNVFVENGVNILDITAKTNEGLKARLFARIEIQDIDHLRTVVRSLEQLKEVHSVSRISTV